MPRLPTRDVEGRCWTRTPAAPFSRSRGVHRWFEDGALRTAFEDPSARDGGSPDELVPLLREVGFPLTPQGEHDESAPAVDGKPTEGVCTRNGPTRRSRRPPTEHGRRRTRRPRSPATSLSPGNVRNTTIAGHGESSALPSDSVSGIRGPKRLTSGGIW
ncbi:DUF6461 domain-containing protein [Streptomyces eurythermus]